jgi:hypothetical protein
MKILFLILMLVATNAQSLDTYSIADDYEVQPQISYPGQSNEEFNRDINNEWLRLQQRWDQERQDARQRRSKQIDYNNRIQFGDQNK